jgi:hypothetical protein
LGTIYYYAEGIHRIVHAIREQLQAGTSVDAVLSVGELGSFTLRSAHHSWTRSLMLGALAARCRGGVVALISTRRDLAVCHRQTS